ncbi:AAA family ATPase [Hymenobacter sp. B81]|uniref:AAA family ATPase n=1 Tax=Hymenobacter sp. B81 TaxID=3344878 RepID=UPI0037DD9773
MARADLLLKLVRASLSGDSNLIKKVVQAVIAEERVKQHNVIANQLEEALNTFPASLAPSPSRSVTPVLYDKIDSFLYSISPNKPLGNLVLNSLVVNAIREFVLEFARADVLRSYSLEPRNRVLLVGEPGNGKTSIAEVIATELMLPMFVIRYDGIIGSYLGETASRLEKMFNFIKTQQCVLFFDEFDAIGKERGDEHETGEIKRVVSSLLLQIDKLPSYVIVVAATNHSELLDKAVWRRFQIKLNIDKPNKDLIKNWLDRFESNFGHKLPAAKASIVNKLHGLSFAEIEEFGLSIRRRFVLSMPAPNLREIVNFSLEEVEDKKGFNNA